MSDDLVLLRGVENLAPKQSRASWLAAQAEDDRHQFLKSLTKEELEHLTWDWSFWGRADQQLPVSDWFVWLILAGRGWGSQN